MDTRITRPELTGLPRPRYSSRPYTNAVPLTFRNSATMLEQVEAIKQFLGETLLVHIESENEAVVASWNAAIDELLTMIETNDIELQDAVLLAIANDEDGQFATWLRAQISASIQEKDDDPGVYKIASPAPIITPPVSGLRPDPDNPGFWI